MTNAGYKRRLYHERRAANQCVTCARPSATAMCVDCYATKRRTRRWQISVTPGLRDRIKARAEGRGVAMSEVADELVRRALDEVGS